MTTSSPKEAAPLVSALTEMKLYGQGTVPPDPRPDVATSATPSASYTSSWKSVAAINDGIDLPASWQLRH